MSKKNKIAIAAAGIGFAVLMIFVMNHIMSGALDVVGLPSSYRSGSWINTRETTERDSWAKSWDGWRGYSERRITLNPGKYIVSVSFDIADGALNFRAFSANETFFSLGDGDTCNASFEFLLEIEERTRVSFGFEGEGGRGDLSVRWTAMPS